MKNVLTLCRTKRRRELSARLAAIISTTVIRHHNFVFIFHSEDAMWNAEILYIEVGGTYRNHWALGG
jgi:hypothetical protein